MEPLKTSVVSLGDGIFAIDQQMVRAFVIVGSERALLLDTGAVRVDLPALVRGITSLPLTVVLTHGDGDHIANLPDFTDAFVHPADTGAVHSHEACTAVRLHPLGEGDVFDLGGRTLRVLETPGHTMGSVSLLDAENGQLFSGDTLSRGPVFMFGARRNLALFLQSLKRLQQLRDEGLFHTVYGCHNTCPITAEEADELIACTEGILDGTLAGVPAPMPMPSETPPLLVKYGHCGILIDPLTPGTEHKKEELP